MIGPSPARLVLAGAAVSCLGIGALPAADAAKPAPPPPQPAATNFAATVAFLDTSGHRATVMSDTPVKAVITITNTSTQSTGFASARISPTAAFAACPIAGNPGCVAPATDAAGWQAAFSGNVIQARNLTGSPIAKGATITVSAWVKPTAACTVALASWPVQVWGGNNFSGTVFTGGPATPVPFLRFTQQPPNATASGVSMSPPALVTSFDGCGAAAAPTQPITLTDAATQLKSSYSTSTVGSVTTLNGVQFNTFDYTDTLTASAIGYTPDTSSAFLVAEKVQPCNPANCNPLTLDSQPQTNAVITPAASPGQADALVSGSALDPDNSLCGEAGAGIPASQVSSTIAVDAPVGKTVTFTLGKALVHAISNNGTPFMNVCMRTVDATGTHDVELPNCPTSTAQPQPACVVSRGKNKANEIIVIRLPVGDPHFNVH